MPRVRFSMRALFTVVALTATLLGLITWLAQLHARANAEAEIVNCLKTTACTLSSYVTCRPSMKQPLPAPVTVDKNGVDLYSWRLQIIRFLTNQYGNADLNKSWNSPSNRSVAAHPCWAYCTSKGTGPGALDTDVLAVTGAGTAFDPAASVTVDEMDGDVILLMEAADSGCHWMEPGDYRVEDLKQWTGKLRDCVKSLNDDQIHVLFADGEIWSLSGETPVERIKPFFTLEGAKSHSRSAELEKYRLKKWSTLGIVDAASD